MIKTVPKRFKRSNERHFKYVTNYFSATTELLIYPVLGFLGIAGNVVTGIILKRSGLAKPTNVLLLALAVSSIICLLPTVNIFSMLRHFNKAVHNRNNLWEFQAGNSGLAYFCFQVTRVIFFQGRYGSQVTSSICVLITLERLVVIFFPMKIKSIITRERTVAMVVFAYLLWIPLLVLSIRACVAEIIFFPDAETYGLKIGFKESDLLVHMGMASDWLSGILPLVFIIIGTVAMSAKLKFILRNRRRLTSSLRTAHSLRISKTLIVVCVFFSVLHLMEFVYFFRTFEGDENRLMGKIASFLSYVESASHFVVYIVLNKNFRDIIVKLMKISNI